jgi:lipopolysaccharide export system permease protein
MRTLSKYVLIELLKVFFVSLTALTLLMIVVGVIREATDQSLPLAEVLRLIPYILPDALRVAVPVTLLLATTVVYGRMSGSNEVVATKAMGISPMVLLWPTLFTAFVLSIVAIWLNDLAVSWGRRGAQRVVVEAVEEIILSMLRSQKAYSCSRFAINVKNVEGRTLKRVTLTMAARGDSPGMTVTAEEAELHANRAAGVLKIVLRNGELDVDGKVFVKFPDVLEREIPLRHATRTKDQSSSPSTQSLAVIPEATAEQRAKLEQHDQELAARAAYQMLCGDFDGLTSGEWKTRIAARQKDQNRLYRLLLEPHRRCAAGFSCFCFAFVGAPMAIRLKKSDFLTVFFLCFLPILIAYYPLMIYGIDGAKSGNIPAQGVWAGNVLLLVWGVWLMRRVIRY